MKPNLILLDCDGVIVDSEPVTNGAIADNLRTYGLDMTTQECMDMFVGGTLSGVGDIVRNMGFNLPANWPDIIHDQAYDALRKGVPVFDNLHRFLDRADDLSVPVCVVSNGPMAKMEITLSQHDLWDRFQGKIFSAHAHGNPKPDPGMILSAMEKHGAAPAQTWMVDDSASGVKAGMRAGVHTFAFVPAGQSVPDTEFTQRVSGFGELLQMLG